MSYKCKYCWYLGFDWQTSSVISAIHLSFDRSEKLIFLWKHTICGEFSVGIGFLAHLTNKAFSRMPRVEWQQEKSQLLSHSLVICNMNSTEISFAILSDNKQTRSTYHKQNTVYKFTNITRIDVFGTKWHKDCNKNIENQTYKLCIHAYKLVIFEFNEIYLIFEYMRIQYFLVQIYNLVIRITK